MICLISLWNSSLGQSTDQEIFVTSSEDTLWGTFSSPQPSIDTNQTLVLIIAGSGPTDRNGNNSVMKNYAYKMLANDLSKFGVASIRYDKRGVGESTAAYIQEDSLLFSQNVTDASLFYQWAQEKGFRDIVILGHSEGSLIGMLLAQQTTPKGYISLAGAGRPIHEVLKEQYQSTAPIVRDSAHKVIEILASGQKIDTLSPWLYSVFRPSIQPYIISWMQISPTSEIQKLQCPILIVQGDQDMQVATIDAEQLHAANTNSTLAIIGGMNHVLKKVSSDKKENKASYNQPDLPLHPDLVYEIMSFLKHRD